MTAAAASPRVPPEDAPASDGVAGRIGPDEQADDLTLVAQLKDGDRAAGSTLVERHRPALLGYLRRLTGSAPAAEETYQQAWLAALENLARFDHAARGANFRAWLFRIATNKAHDRHRARGRDRKLHDTLRLDADGHHPHQPDADALAAEEADRLRAAVDALPAAQREVVLLRYYANLKFTEIAEMTGCPLNTALGRMHKAAAKLRAALKQPKPEAKD